MRRRQYEKKSEIKDLRDNELIVEYVRSTADLASNYVLNRGVKRLQVHCADLECELVKRGILTEHDVEVLNR